MKYKLIKEMEVSLEHYRIHFNLLLHSMKELKKGNFMDSDIELEMLLVGAHSLA